MSDYYLQSDNSQSKIVSFSTLKGVEKNSYDTWLPRACIPWSKELSWSLFSFFQGVDYPFRQVVSIPYEEPLRSEIRRFFLSLDAYIDSPHPVIPYRDILYGATDKGYATILKRIKTKSFQTTWHVENFEFPEWWNNTPSYHITDIGDIFNYSYLIFWKEDDPDDYLYGLIPVDIKQPDIEKFKDYLRDILPDRESFERIANLEVLSEVSSSMSLKRGTFEHLPHYKLKPKYLSFSRRRHTAERSIIRVSPENTRDSVLIDPEDLNTVSLIDRQIMEILSRMKGHIHLKDKDRISKRLKGFYKKFRFFLQRDLQKEGITKPKELCKAVLEVLHEEYPDIDIFGYTSFYDDFYLRVDKNEVIPMKRGHGLGMANAITTLMQLTIHRWIVDEIIDDIADFRGDCIALNDDYVVGFQDEYHLEAYWDKEDEVLSKLSVLRQPSKSFRSEKRFVIAERYFTIEGEYEKISYQLRELLLPLACANVTHAKEYFTAAQTYVDSSLVPRYMEDIRAYWGYEFFPDEFMYPSKVGGWINSKIGGIDLTLKLLDNLPYNSMIPRGFKAAQESIYVVPKGDEYESPWVTLLGYPKIPEQYKGHLNMVPESIINDKFGKILKQSPMHFERHWSKLYERRQKAFKKSFPIPKEDLIDMMWNHFDTVQFYPSRMMIDHFAEIKIIQANIRDIYIDPNPIMSMVSKYNTIAYPFKEEFSIKFTNKDFFSKKVSSLYSKDVERTLKSEVLALFFTGKNDEIYVPKDQSYKIEQMYLEPFKIGWTAAKLDWGMGYPILKKKYTHPLIAEKKTVFNRLFSTEEILIFSRVRLKREIIKLLADYLNNNPDEDLQTLLESLAKMVPKKEFTRYVEPQKEREYPENVITMSDLISDGSYKYYNWRNNPEDYPPADEEVNDMLEELELINLFLSHDLLHSLEEKLELRDRIKSLDYKNVILCKIAIHLGLPDLAEPPSFEDFSSDEEGGGIFPWG